MGFDLRAKYLELVKEAVPHATRFGVFWNPTNQVHRPSLSVIEDAAHQLQGRAPPRARADPKERSRLPAIYGVTDIGEAGGMMAYGVDLSSMFRRSASFVDRILKGARPGDLPVEQPTKFDLVINRRGSPRGLK